jgi:hypothetical protein
MAEFVNNTLIPYVPYVMVGSMIVSFGILAVEQAAVAIKSRKR